LSCSLPIAGPTDAKRSPCKAGLGDDSGERRDHDHGGRSGLIFATGLAVLGLWLFAYYRSVASDEQRDFIVPMCNVLAYVIGALAITQAPWVAVALTVAATLLLAGRTRLHAIAQTVPIEEVFTTGQFLLLVGVALPLLPDVPFAGVPELTPHRTLLAVVAVSTLSYCSYLLTRYVRPKGATLFAATLGGLYSSTATTVVLARRSRAAEATSDLSAGIVLATAFMYLRLLAIIALFNAELGRTLAIPLSALFVAGIAAAGIVYVFNRSPRTSSTTLEAPSIRYNSVPRWCLRFCSLRSPWQPTSRVPTTAASGSMPWRRSWASRTSTRSS
jgi:uncharacterized membrane protein (DUF4010 family)